MTAQPDEPAPASQRSALGVALTQVGDRWSLLIVAALLDGPRRFQELVELVEGISASILSQRLKRLEAEGLVLAAPYSRRPPRFAYELTAAGAELAGALRLLAQWGAGRGEGEDSLRHDTCGTPAEARWWCPTCTRLVDGEVSELHHL